MDLTDLRNILVTYFSDSELRDLCFDLGIDYENLAGEGKAGKARELVAYCARHARLNDLESTCRHLRPHAFADSSGVPTGVAPSQAGEQQAGTVVNQSGGVTINAQTVNITGDVTGRDKKSSSDTDVAQSPSKT